MADSVTPQVRPCAPPHTMTEDNDTLAVLFVDIAESTRLLNDLGEDAGGDALKKALRILADITKQCHGKVVDVIGDELVCTFREADAASDAATQMQQEMSAAAMSGHVPEGLEIRVGIHMGPVGFDGDDIRGSTVHAAKRMETAAKSGQIIVSATTRESFELTGVRRTRFVAREHIKGFEDPFDLYELIWDFDKLTIMDRRATPRAEPENELEVMAADKRHVVSGRSPVVTIGRGASCDIVVVDRGLNASRLHARIEYQGGRFQLVDMSTNGSCVMDDLGTDHVHRDTRVLGAKGIVVPGTEPNAARTSQIRFRQK